MQDSTKKVRGRPRNYERGTALDAMMNVFWRKGYSATSLDELSAATGMQRPSLYQAFGSKLDMYGQALEHFIQRMAEAATRELFQRHELSDALLHFYYAVLDTYFEESSELGCMVFCTAVAETSNQPGIRDALRTVIDQIDAALKSRLQIARQAGQLPERADIPGLATLAQALLQHLAIRARAGDAKASLRKMARSSIRTLLAAYQ